MTKEEKASFGEGLQELADQFEAIGKLARSAASQGARVNDEQEIVDEDGYHSALVKTLMSLPSLHHQNEFLREGGILQDSEES